MIEQKVQMKVFPIDYHPFLPLNEGKAVSKFQNEFFQIVQNGAFQIVSK